METLSVGLLGGMFNPVHQGHTAIAHSFLESGRIDQLWVVPSFSPPHKSVTNLAAFHHRVAMLELAYEGMSKVRILQTEYHLPQPGYTYQTLCYLQKEYPKTIFYWCIGSDNLIGFSSWYRYEDILQNWQLIVAERPDFISTGVSERVLNRALFVPHSPLSVSSTQVRENLNGEEAHLHPNVLRYIREKQLYSF